MDTHAKIKERIDTMLPYLNERQTRLYLSNEALSYGWGGISLISNLSGGVSKMPLFFKTISFNNFIQFNFFSK